MQVNRRKSGLVFFLFHLSNFKEKKMPLKRVEFLEKLMLGTFSIKLIQCEKAGSIGKFFISLVNLKTQFFFRN